MVQIGKGLLSAIGVFIAGLATYAPDAYKVYFVVAGSIIVFVAQALFDAGLIPAAKR